MMITRMNLLIAVTAYQVRDAAHNDVGEPTDHTTAVDRARAAGGGSYLVATGEDGKPLTRDDGTEYVSCTVD